MELLNILKKQLPSQTYAEADASPAIDVTGCKTIALAATFDAPPADQVFLSGVAASLTFQDVTLTAVERGAAGNSITITLLDPSANSEPLAIEVTDTDIVVTLATDGGGSITTTATELVTALNLDGDVTALVSASGSGASPLTDAVEDALEGGINSAIDVDANTITIASHGYGTGQVAQFVTDGTLPDPLTVLTDYYLIRVNANTIQVAETLEDALDGVPIVLTDQGSSGAENEVDIEDLSGGTATLQKSLGGGPNSLPESEWVWSDEGNAVNVTQDGTLYFEKVDPTANFYRLKYAITTGSLTADVLVLGKGMV
jgi:hypothetical protein